MALVVKDRVKETTATTGTLDVVLAGAASAFQAFSGVLADNDTTHYCITSSNDWEVGEGTYTSGTNTLQRTTVLDSSNGGSKISLTGTSTVFLTYPADRSVYCNADNHVVVDSGIDLTPLADGFQPAYKEGRIFYDDEDKTLALYNDEADVTLQLGLESYIRVRNNSGATITNGKAVYISGSQGTHAEISLADASGEDSAKAVGVATHDIEDSTFGYVTTFGIVRGMDTSALGEGSGIYLASSGTLAASPAVPPDHNVLIGYTITTHASNGAIFVQPHNPRMGDNHVGSTGNINDSGIPYVSLATDDGDGVLSTVSSFTYDDAADRVNLPTGGIKFNDGTTQTTKAVVSGDNISLLVNDSGYINAHPTVAASTGTDNSGRTYVQDILVDSYGHVTGIATATETVTDTDTTYTAGTGLELSGTEFNIDASVVQTGDNVSVLTNDANYLTGTGSENEVAKFNADGSLSGVAGLEANTDGDPGLDIFREAGQTTTLVNLYTESTGIMTVFDENGWLGVGSGDPSYQVDVADTGNFGALLVNGVPVLTSHPSITASTGTDNGGRTYVQDILLDSNGHVTGITTATETVTDTDTTYTAGTGLELNGTEFNATTTGDVSGPASSTDRGVAVWNGTDGQTLSDSTVTIDTDGNMTVPAGMQLGTTNYMGFDSITVTGVTNGSPQQVTFFEQDLTGTQNSTYLFMIRLANITTNEINGSSYFVRKSGTASTSNWEAFEWGKRTTSAGDCPEIYIDPGPASGGAVKVRLNANNPAGGDTVLCHITAWRVDRGDNDIQAIVPEAVWARTQHQSNIQSVFPIATGTMNLWLPTTSTLGIQTDSVATEALDVQDKTYLQSVYNGVPSPTGEGSIELDLDAGNIFNITLDENKTLTIKTNTDDVGQRFLVNLRQASGVTPGSSYTVTWWNNIKWMDDTEPTLSDSGNLIDTFDFHIPSGNKFFGYILGTGVYDG